MHHSNLKYLLIVTSAIFLLSSNQLCFAAKKNSKPVAAKPKKSTPAPKTLNRDLPQILKQKQIVIAVPQNADPVFFSRTPNGQETGFAIDMAKAIAKNLDVKIVFNHDAQTYDDLINLLAENKADLAVGDVSKTLGRGQRVLFTHTYLKLHPAMFVNRVWEAVQESNPLLSLDLLNEVNNKKCRVGIITGTAYVDFANQIIPNAQKIYFNSDTELLQALDTNKIDVAFDNDLQIRKFILDDYTLVLKYKAIVFNNYHDLLALAVPQNHHLLKEWLNLYLELGNKTYTATDLIEYAERNGE